MIRGGRSYVSSSPAFSNDAKRLLLCTGNTVSIFSSSTGLQVASLEGHAALVTTVIVVPPSSPASRILCYCWTASLDGTIRYWDFSAPELMKTIDIRLPIFSMVIPSLLGQQNEGNDRRPDVFAYILVENIREQAKHRKALRGQVQKCNLTKSSLVGGLTLKETEKPECFNVSPSGEFFGVVNKHKLHVWKVPEIESERVVLKKIDLHHTKVFTVFAFHHSQKIVAAGDVTGRILIWRGFGKRTFSSNAGPAMSANYTEDRPGVRGEDDADSCSTWHWHPSEVNTLAFSSDGEYLYSGGREGVLVVWQLDTGKKKFLPRIGSPLLYFVQSPDPSLASISCADNQVHLLKMPSMEILKSISGIKLPCSFPEAFSGSFTKCAFDEKAGVVALCTENYGIQLYSLLDDHGISEVQVCERNHQPGDEITVVVSHVALSIDGSYMSTVEVKLPEEDIGGLVCLKFWASESRNKQFRLLTVIYEPHRDSHISAVAFRPAGRMGVTSSYGGDFKTWVCSDEIPQNDGKAQTSGWSCYAVGSYKRKPMTAAAFSADGSVLAVAAETVITLWDPDRNILVAVIGDTSMQIKTLSFIGQSGYILSASCGSKPQLAVWSLSKLSKIWSYSLQIEAMTCLGDSSRFAVLALLPTLAMESHEMALGSRDGVILVFNVDAPVPVASWSVRKAEGGALAFVQSSPSLEKVADGEAHKGLLAFINGNHEYVLFNPLSSEVTERFVTHHNDLVSEGTDKYGYASIYGELQEVELKKNRPAEILVNPLEKPWDSLFSGSSHNLPPLTKLCSAFLESLLERRSEAVE